MIIGCNFSTLMHMMCSHKVLCKTPETVNVLRKDWKSFKLIPYHTVILIKHAQPRAFVPYGQKQLASKYYWRDWANHWDLSRITDLGLPTCWKQYVLIQLSAGISRKFSCEKINNCWKPPGLSSRWQVHEDYGMDTCHQLRGGVGANHIP